MMTAAILQPSSYGEGVVPPFFHIIESMSRRTRADLLASNGFDAGKARNLRRRKT